MGPKIAKEALNRFIQKTEGPAARAADVPGLRAVLAAKELSERLTHISFSEVSLAKSILKQAIRLDALDAARSSPNVDRTADANALISELRAQVQVNGWWKTLQLTLGVTAR